MTTLFNRDIADLVRTAGHRYIELVKLKQVLVKNVRDNTINPFASTVAAAFSGYPFVVDLLFRSKYCDDLVATESAISNWCSETCEGKFTSSVFSAEHKDGVWIINSEPTRYVADHWFWAFENEQDALMFSLRW